MCWNSISSIDKSLGLAPAISWTTLRKIFINDAFTMPLPLKEINTNDMCCLMPLQAFSLPVSYPFLERFVHWIPQFSLFASRTWVTNGGVRCALSASYALITEELPFKKWSAGSLEFAGQSIITYFCRNWQESECCFWSEKSSIRPIGVCLRYWMQYLSGRPCDSCNEPQWYQLAQIHSPA